MPTGYTQDLTAETPLRDFTLRCARAFGATIHLREESLAAELTLPVATIYSQQWARKAEAELQELKEITPEQADARARAEWERACQDFRARVEERRAIKEAYEAMLLRVLQWEPPTPEHKVFKTFMLAQLRESIAHDCDGSYDTAPEQQPGPVWRLERMERLEKEALYHRQKQLEEEESVQERRAWILALQQSLPTE
jgi:hypothetical protein